MYAIFEAGGKQFQVTTGDTLKVDLMRDTKKGEAVVFDRVLMLGGDQFQVGTPLVTNAKVHATVTDMGANGEGVKAEKLLVYKKRRRKGYDKLIGHRQRYTEVKIEKIEA